MNLFIHYLIAHVIPFYQLNYCFLMSSAICKGHREFKYCIKHHMSSLEHCISCKLSPVYSLHSPICFYLDDTCGRIRESTFVYLISVFCSCSTLNRLEEFFYKKYFYK